MLRREEREELEQRYSMFADVALIIILFVFGWRSCRRVAFSTAQTLHFRGRVSNMFHSAQPIQMREKVRTDAPSAN